MEARAAQPLRLRLGFVALLALLYGGAHLTWYWGTPLGRSAVLDERENLQLAGQIATGTLPAEPFYRAMGYPLFLSALSATGLLDETHPQAATAAGLLFHVLNTWLVALLARRWFGSERAGWIAGLLHGLNPVLIHYATQILDAVPANSLVLAGLVCVPGRDGSRTNWKYAAGLSLAWAAAALVRPQLLLLWLAFSLVWLAATGNWRRQLPALLAAIGVGGVLWLAQGLWSLAWGGEFRLLPWQGTYNLWAANHPDANGRYYTQRTLIEYGPFHQNPARVESEMLYRRARGGNGPLNINDLNAYWSQRLREEVSREPGKVLVVMLRKAVYLAGNFEQYNNKTYSFHKERSPWLRWNPLGWGVLLLAGTLGFIALGKASRPLLLAAAALVAGIMVGYASARFRVPLTALLCIAAGGALAAPGRWWRESTPYRARLVALLLAIGALSYGGWCKGNDTTTTLQDHVLLGHAAQRVGEDEIAWNEARTILRLAPARRDAVNLGLTSYFNLLLKGVANPAEESEWLAMARQGSKDYEPELIGLALWRAGDPAGVQLWRRHGSVGICVLIVLSGEATPEETRLAHSIGLSSRWGPFFSMLAARESPDGNPDWKAAADRLFPVKR